MYRILKKNRQSIGLPPGTLLQQEGETRRVRIDVLDYNEVQVTEKEITDIAECSFYKEQDTVTWININGIHQPDIIERIGKQFAVHPLVLEDITNATQRPKVEDFDDYLYIVLKMFYFTGDNKDITSEQISLLLGRNCVITFQEKPGDIFDPMRERIRRAKGRIRRMKADYLAYSLIDAIIDNYFIIMDSVGEKIELLENAIITDPSRIVLNEIHTLKNDVLFLRKPILPLREVIMNLERGGSALVHETTYPYLRDLYDNTIHVMEALETYRDVLSGLTDLYLSNISNKMNEVMKVLTIIATIFIPLTFIAGIYGMNFKHMPELEWYMGYPMVLVVMLVMALLMLLYFKKKKWL